MSNGSMNIDPDVSFSISKDGCTPYIPEYGASNTMYGYVPSQTIGILFCVLFALSMVAHIVQFLWKRTWWCSVFAVGCLGELSRRGLNDKRDSCAENEYDVSGASRMGRPDLVIPMSLRRHPIPNADIDSDYG
jgi:hypothetical protein